MNEYTEMEIEQRRDKIVARYCATMGIEYIERPEDTANDRAELTDDEIAALEAMTDETANDFAP